MNSLPADGSEPPRGRLRIYLGYAAGVGKTFQMLTDGRDASRAGIDVVVGYFETHQRPDTLALAEGLALIPRRAIVYRDHAFEELDTELILVRRPQLCLVDEFAHTNVIGADREKRWEDVLVLLDAGIDVWTTMNVQHIESLNDTVFEMTGIRVRETVPDWVIKQAREIQLVDVTPEALLNRLRRGAVYTGEMARTAVERFFRESNLRALRELALREAAHEVRVRQDEQDAAASAAGAAAAAAADTGEKEERILVIITADPASAMLIRRGRRVADYLRGDCLALYVHREDHFGDIALPEREVVEGHLSFARNLRIETRSVHGLDAARTIVDFAHRNNVTQILLARPLECSRHPLRGRGLIGSVIRLARDIQITVAAVRHPHSEETASTAANQR